MIPNYFDGSDYTIDSYVYYGSSGGFTISLGVPTIGAVAAAVEDLDEDGYLDIVFANHNDGADYTVCWGSASGDGFSQAHLA